MATVTVTTTLSDSADKAEFYGIINNATVTDIVNADISASANIADSKLATITTAGKVNISALVATNQADGDVIYYNGSSWVRLGIGTAGQTLKVNGTATAPIWA